MGVDASAFVYFGYYDDGYDSENGFRTAYELVTGEDVFCGITSEEYKEQFEAGEIDLEIPEYLLHVLDMDETEHEAWVKSLGVEVAAYGENYGGDPTYTVSVPGRGVGGSWDSVTEFDAEDVTVTEEEIQKLKEGIHCLGIKVKGKPKWCLSVYMS